MVSVERCMIHELLSSLFFVTICAIFKRKIFTILRIMYVFTCTQITEDTIFFTVSTHRRSILRHSRGPTEEN